MGVKKMLHTREIIRPLMHMHVVSLDPKQSIGPETSVTKLFRVGDGLTIHFVYFDRRGWYCDGVGHRGPDCPAVEQAKLFDREKK